MILFILLVALGLPLLSGGRGGLSVLVGPSAGYLLSWPLAAFCIGYMTEKIWNHVKTWKVIIINVVFGVLLVSFIGAPVMAIITHTSIWAGLVGATAFLPGDCIKAVIAAIIALQLKAISPLEEKMHNS
ncbi:biotin transporter BioY [Paenibacillus pini]|uniref:biotin transporter BioY n=1 Tax=Paenibacillus pini TaxID=669461 RepID=UPI000A980E02|nr:biotin transporter BioY [Paenibacillus pini]